MQSLSAQFTTTEGTGDILLDGAARANCRTIESAHSAGDIVRVTVLDSATGDSEVILGVVRASPARIERIETRLAIGPNASGPTSPIDWQAGSKLVVEDLGAEDFIEPLGVADYLIGGHVGRHATVANAVLPLQGAVSGGGTAINVSDPTFSLVLAFRAASASTANTGYQVALIADVARVHARYYQRTVLEYKNIAGLNTLIGIINSAATDGAMFFFTGTDVAARFGSTDSVTTYTLTNDVVYVFELEVNAAGTACTFTVRDINEAVLWTETVSGTLSTADLRPYSLRLIYPTWPASNQVAGHYIASWIGTRRAYLASRSGVMR